MTHEQQPSTMAFLRSRTGLVLLALLVIAALYLVTAHTSHVFDILPYALLLLTPFLHLFMHAGHSGHGHQTEDHARHSGSNRQ